MFLKATKVDGVYTCDPVKHPDKAQRYERLTYRQVTDEGLQVGGSRMVQPHGGGETGWFGHGRCRRTCISWALMTAGFVDSRSIVTR